MLHGASICLTLRIILIGQKKKQKADAEQFAGVMKQFVRTFYTENTRVKIYIFLKINDIFESNINDDEAL